MASAQIINDAVLPSNPPDELIRHDAEASHVVSEKHDSYVQQDYHPVEQYSSQEDARSHAPYDSDFPPPTAQEVSTLRKVPGSIPWIAWMLCIVELAERASYYGATTVFTNFMTNPLPPGSTTGQVNPNFPEDNAGALNQGSVFAQAFTLLFKFLAYTLPIFGAWLGDAKIGRYKAILIGVLLCGIAHIVQVIGAIPSILVNGQGLAPFLISLFLLAIGAGIFKPNILPTVIDQYTHQEAYTKLLKSGERVIVDPEMTMTRISLYFYWFVNMGAFFAIATVYVEKYVGFWMAFLLPGILYFLLPLVLLFTAKKTIRYPPNGTEIETAGKILWMCIKRSKGVIWRKDFWDQAKPSVLAANGIATLKKGRPIPWTDRRVDDVARTLGACAMFLYFPLWYLNDGGIGAIATFQANAMTTNGAPNDLLGNFNPLTIIVFVPILSHVIYPALERAKMMPGRITRITFGFFLAIISSLIGMGLQFEIYRTSPCGKLATKCKDADGHSLVSPLSVWAQIPIFALGAISECFCQVTAYEIAYARSPKNMKAVVMSCFLFMNALSSAIAQITSPFTKDPNLPWIWLAPAIGMSFLAVDFFFRYRYMNNDAFIKKWEDERGNDGVGSDHEHEHEVGYEAGKGGGIISSKTK